MNDASSAVPESWQAYGPWRSGVIPAKQESKYSQYLIAILLFGVWVPILGAIGWRELTLRQNAWPLYFCGVMSIATVFFLYRFFTSRDPVKATLKLAGVPISPGTQLTAEIIFEHHVKPESPLELYLRAFTIRYYGLLPLRTLQPVGPTLYALRQGVGQYISLIETHRQVKQISADQLSGTNDGFVCPVVFAIPENAAEASTRRARTITVWTLMCRSKAFEFDLWFGNLPVFRRSDP